MNKKDIIDTITFISNNKIAEVEMRNEIEQSISLLENLVIISSEYKREGITLSEIIGFDKAYALLQENPDTKILLYGFLPIEYVLESHQKAFFIFKHSNVRYLRIPFDTVDIISAFLKPPEIKESRTT